MQSSDGALDSAEVESLMHSLALLDSACKYRLDSVHIEVPHDDPLASEAAWNVLVEGLRSGADGSVGASFEACADAISSLAEGLEERGSLEQVDRCTSTVVSTSKVQLEILGEPGQAPTFGRYKSPGFNLDYSGSISSSLSHHLTVLPPGSSPRTMGLRQLLSPIQLDAHGANSLKAYTWKELPGPLEGVRAYRLHSPGEPWPFLALEIATETGLPLAASYHRDADSGEAHSLGLFSYGPLSEGSAQLWLKAVVTAVHNARTTLVSSHQLSQIDFDVSPSDLTLEVAEPIVLFDLRTPEEASYGRDWSAWPQEIQERISVGNAEGDPAQRLAEHEHADPSPPPSRLPIEWGGLGLMVGGLAFLLRSRAVGRVS